MKKLTKNKPLLMTTLGLLIMAQSIFWEYVRVRPNYRFLIEPWSHRGFEVNQGLVIAAGSTLLIAIALALAFGILKEGFGHSLLAVGLIVGFGVVASILTDTRDVKLHVFAILILAVMGGTTVRSLLEQTIPEAWSKRRRAARIGMWLGGTAFTFIVLLLIFGSERPVWLIILVAGVVVGGLALYRPPSTLANWRMLINGIVGLWVLSMAMSASIRVSLGEAQFALNGINADGQDLQITSGVLLAWFGGLLAFAGAVGMWAKRRDEIVALERAHKQQEAARESEAQLAVTG